MRAPFLTDDFIADLPRLQQANDEAILSVGDSTDKAYLVQAGSAICPEDGQSWHIGEIINLTEFLALETYNRQIISVGSSVMVLIPRTIFKAASDRDHTMTWPLSVCLASEAARGARL